MINNKKISITSNGMEIIKDYDLKDLNTFGVHARAKYFVTLEREEDLPELFNLSEFKNNQKLFLGGGSNILFTKDFDGIVILNKLKGIEVVSEDTESVFIKCMGGEIWDDLVQFTVERGLWGIENLALVPGTAGAAPMQNIGAYGVELKNTLEDIEAYDIESGEKKVFKNAECEFGYRDSIFKSKVKGKYFITAITIKLSKISKPNISYKILENYLKENNIEVKSSKDVSIAVSAIRRSKLPYNTKVLGNAGSFFKNVYVSRQKLAELLSTYPDLSFFEEGEKIKINSGWLVEKCGWKGKKVGNVGVHEKQALVLINYGGATGEEIINFANQIIDSVKEKFNLQIVPEVNII
ncbi:MAG: UDP-N-acetylmuramate dehydrogenase [Patescibacteria group bacterium]